MSALRAGAPAAMSACGRETHHVGLQFQPIPGHAVETRQRRGGRALSSSSAEVGTRNAANVDAARALFSLRTDDDFRALRHLRCLSCATRHALVAPNATRSRKAASRHQRAQSCATSMAACKRPPAAMLPRRSEALGTRARQRSRLHVPSCLRPQSRLEGGPSRRAPARRPTRSPARPDRRTCGNFQRPGRRRSGAGLIGTRSCLSLCRAT